MKNILITGCNRGLGLGLVRNLIEKKNPPSHLIATCRSIEKAQELQQIANQHSNVHILELDVRNTESFSDFSNKVSDIVKDNGLNVLFNNAGVAPKSTRINFLKAEQMLETFYSNTLGPLMLTKALLPELLKAAQNQPEAPMSSQKAAVVNMTSSLGSINANVEGGLYPYRCSKAALNMATKSLSVDLKKDGILVTCIHPGWVKTDMGGANAPLKVDYSVLKIIDLLIELNEVHHGGYYQYDGKKLEW